MQELVPYISCLVNPHEFSEAISSTYSEIYVAAKDGYYKHMKLRGGRHIRLKVDSLPKTSKITEEVEIEEELNFLPAGKVPYEYLEQIVHFFKEVMRLKKADYEAHAWILWSKEKGYYISVPKQTVSKAAVQFSYDQDALPSDSIVVVDIHSHNTMGAFYSGTDNNNDKNGIYYSGVVGKLDHANPQIVFRFNMHEVKLECKIADIFEIPKKEVTIPQAWIDNVEVKATPAPTKFGSRTANQLSMWDDMMHNLSGGMENYRKNIRQDTANNESRDEINRLIDEQVADLNNQAEDHIADMEAQGYIFVPSGHELNGEEADPVGDGNFGDEYEYYKGKYGVEVAEAKDNIDRDLDEIGECDEALVDIIRTAYSLLGETGRTDLGTNGM